MGSQKDEWVHVGALVQRESRENKHGGARHFGLNDSCWGCERSRMSGRKGESTEDA